MEAGIFERIRENLLVKRQNVTRWLAQAPAPQRQMRLGPAHETAVRAHVRMIDETISRTGEPRFGLCVVCHDPVEPEVLEMDYTATICAVGLVEKFVVRSRTLAMAPGDVLLLYTDGVTEAINRAEEEFGVDRLAEVVYRTARPPVRDLVRAVRSAVEAFAEGRGLDDDTTILACKTTVRR